MSVWYAQVCTCVEDLIEPGHLIVARDCPYHNLPPAAEVAGHPAGWEEVGA